MLLTKINILLFLNVSLFQILIDLGSPAVALAQTNFKNLHSLEFVPLPLRPHYSRAREPNQITVAPDDMAGFKGAPNLDMVEELQTKEKKTIWRVHYGSDSLGRRLTKPIPKKANKFVVNLGCSFTWGEGVENEQTLSSYLQAALPRFKIYNYGVVGASPAVALGLLKSKQMRSQIEEPKGIFIFYFYPFQIARDNGAYPSGKWMAEAPHFYKSADGTLLREASLAEKFSARFKLFPFWDTWGKHFSGIARFLEPDLDAQWRYSCSLLKEIEAEVGRQFSGSHFLIVFSGEERHRCLDHFQGRLLELGPEFRVRSMFYQDGHPKAAYNQILSLKLLADPISTLLLN